MKTMFAILGAAVFLLIIAALPAARAASTTSSITGADSTLSGRERTGPAVPGTLGTTRPDSPKKGSPGQGSGEQYQKDSQQQKDQWSGSDQPKNDETGEMGTEERAKEKKHDYMENRR